MSDPFPGKRLEITCPNCGHKSKQVIGGLQANDRFTCAGCGATLDKKQVRRAIEEAQRGLADLRRKLGRKLK